MLLAPVPWAGRVWALPFLTALVPSERYNAARARRHETLLDFGRQLALQARRWLPGRDLVFVADSSFSSLLFLSALRRRGLTVITRLRLDAALYDPAPPRAPGTTGRPRKAGKRLPTLAKVVADAATVWQTLQVEHWYGGGARDLQIATATAVWRHYGLPAVPIRWVLIRDPQKPDAPQGNRIWILGMICGFDAGGLYRATLDAWLGRVPWRILRRVGKVWKTRGPATLGCMTSTSF